MKIDASTIALVLAVFVAVGNLLSLLTRSRWPNFAHSVDKVVLFAIGFASQPKPVLNPQDLLSLTREPTSKDN